MQSGKTKKIVGVIVGSLVAAAVSFSVRYFIQKGSFDKQLTEAASEVNKSCPMMVDEETRLDNAVSLPDKVFQYNYTLINLAKEDVDTTEAHKLLDKGIIDNVKTNPDLASFRDNKVTLVYNYKDKNQDYMLSLKIVPEMYK